MSAKIFITNQKKLASIVNTTPEHLSSIKCHIRGASDDLTLLLQETTGINQTTWASPTRKSTLKQELKAFFKQQREDESIFLRGARSLQ